MKFSKFTLFFILTVFSVSSFAHCVNNRQISSAAHELDESAIHFQQLVMYETGYSHLEDDVYKLSEAAEHLHGLAESGRYDCQHLQKDFRKVSKKMRHLSREFRIAHETHHNYHLNDDFREVTYAFMTLSHSFRSIGRPPHGRRGPRNPRRGRGGRGGRGRPGGHGGF